MYISHDKNNLIWGNLFYRSKYTHAICICLICLLYYCLITKYWKQVINLLVTIFWHIHIMKYLYTSHQAYIKNLFFLEGYQRTIDSWKKHQSTKYYVLHVKIGKKKKTGKSFCVCIKYLWKARLNNVVYREGKSFSAWTGWEGIFSLWNILHF